MHTRTQKKAPQSSSCDEIWDNEDRIPNVADLRNKLRSDWNHRS